ncbi:LysR family transcriptional regulator [Kribbella sp. CA-293567]|uniref:LysR family transcriptional regulator n=1 Tax=Kribbella sp. CA-293567 TaxID=3002436 RepID=UPI0022DE878F|nr:LysR family transcriptional regulator [Kribbella sp. CA-293567]WBQ02532.1 LysR substrate-binding domain-containing protein [Kribbella sp. CA-293567]
MTLNPWRLRLLNKLEAHGTIRAVATALDLSASSVSQQLALLETETRTKLLERTGRRVRLTPAGLILARRAAAILDHMDAVEAELRSFSTEPAGLVRLGAFQSAIHTLVTPAVIRLASTYPHLEIEVSELEPHESLPALRSGEVDLVITTTDFAEEPLGPDLDLVPLTSDLIVLVVPPDHPTAGLGAADLAAYADEPWAFDRPQSYMSNLTTRLCRQAGFEPRVVGRFSNYSTLLRHVEAGLSIAMLPSLAVDPRYEVATRPLVVPVSRAITAAVRRGTPPRPAVLAVLAALT